MHATPDPVLDDLQLGHLAPLVFFYGLGNERPQVDFIAPEEMPDEPRSLLVHASDMTPRLRDYHRTEIDLDVHGKGRMVYQRRNGRLYRQKAKQALERNHRREE
jgi:hypothetical protein